MAALNRQSCPEYWQGRVVIYKHYQDQGILNESTIKRTMWVNRRTKVDTSINLTKSAVADRFLHIDIISA